MKRVLSVAVLVAGITACGGSSSDDGYATAVKMMEARWPGREDMTPEELVDLLAEGCDDEPNAMAASLRLMQYDPNPDDNMDIAPSPDLATVWALVCPDKLIEAYGLLSDG